MEVNDINLKELIEAEGVGTFKNGYVNCPFHNEKTPSLSVHFNSNTNKDTFKCFGCGKSGDAIDFIQAYKNMEYAEARKYLGLEVELNQYEKDTNKIEEYIKKQTSKKGYKLLGIFPFQDLSGEVLYYKVKFLKPDGKKETPYYCIKEGKVLNKRGADKEIPYNLYKAKEGIGKGKSLIIVEGEKDVNTLSNILKNSKYVVTSVKNCKNLAEYFNETSILVIGDTGEAGKKYVDFIKAELFEGAKSFRIVRLPELESLGDNKDVTDWLEAGHRKEELYKAFERSLDLKSNFELQQDRFGIYKQVPSKLLDGAFNKVYITNFQIVEAKSTVNIDGDTEGIELTVKADGVKRVIKALATDFDDIKSFRNRLGSMYLTFEGKIDDLLTLKKWIAKYLITSTCKLVSGAKFMYGEDEKLRFITSSGAITSDGIDKTIKGEDDNFKIELPEGDINKDELKELMEHLFKFTTPARAYSIIGTVVNNLAVAQAEKLGIKLHHLLIIGEAGCGKSTILEKVIAPLLNYPPEQIKAIGEATKFSLIKTLSSGNYTVLYDEFKPSMLSKYRKDELSNILRNLYDRTSVSRGQKNMTVKEYRLSRPLIMAGEESFAYGETAQLERSCIVYLSKNERTTENTKAMDYLKDHESVLNALGKELIKEVLKLNIEAYRGIRKGIEDLKLELGNRLENTVVNICVGIEIFNRVLDRYGVSKVENFIEPVVDNLKAEVLEDKEEVLSTTENLIKKFDELLEDNKIFNKELIIQDKRDETEIYIKTNLMLDEIRKYVKNTNNPDIIILSDSDFRKQAKKAGYILGAGKKDGKVIRVRVEEGGEVFYKTVRFDIYSKAKLRELEVNSIVEPELTPVDPKEEKVIQGIFK